VPRVLAWHLYLCDLSVTTTIDTQMKESILTIPAWQLFLAFVIGSVISEISAFAAAAYFNWDLLYGPYPTLRVGLEMLIGLTYPYLVGCELSRRRATGSRPTSHKRIILTLLVAIVVNLLSVYYMEVYGFLSIVAAMTALFNLIFLLTVISFPARELKSIELKRRAGFIESWKEMLQFMIWPVSVWWLQPTLTYIVIEEEVLGKQR
jgi:hypothetical protein